MRGRAGQPADPGPVAPPYCSDHGCQGRPRPPHHRRGLPGAGRRGEVDRGKDPEHGNALLPAAADSRDAPARSPGQRPDVRHPRPAHRPVQHRVRPVRDLLVGHLRERHLAAGYSTLRTIAHILGRLFWRDLELHHPGISSMRLSAAQVAGWKDWITRKTPRGTVGGPTPCSRSARSTSTSPSGPSTTRPGGRSGRRRARSGQRRSRTPKSCPGARRGWTSGPANGFRSCPFIRSAENGRHAAAERLAACTAAVPGQRYTAGGQELRRAVMTTGETARTWAENPADGRRRDLTLEVHRAFWAWAAMRSSATPASGSKSSPSCRTAAWSSTGCRRPDSSSRCCRSPRPRPTPNGSWSSAPSSPTSCRRSSSDPRRRRRRPARRVLRRQREALEPADAAAVPDVGSGQRTGPSPRRRSASS